MHFDLLVQKYKFISSDRGGEIFKVYILEIFIVKKV